MGEHSISVLLIDDDSVDAELTCRALRSAGYPRFQIDRAPSLAEAAELVERNEYDVALLDLGLPDSPRSETLERFRANCSADLPVIVLTGLDDGESALKSLELGAQDYLGKDDVTSELLSRSIRHAMQRQHLLEQLKTANAMLEQKNDRLAQLYDLAQQFVENVSHEFRTPLTVIREFTSIIRDGLDGPVTPKQAEHLEKVLHRTDDLALMVDDMLDISKLEAGLLGVWRRACRVEEMIENVLGLIKGRADSKRISLKMNVDDALPAVFCDEEKARRVIVNLAVNAIKFTPERGTVEIWARREVNDHSIVIGVTDTGPGLSPENLSVIFQRFRQVDHGLHTSTKGFGLGLNIAKELVALNLGEINVASEVGAGSSFSFTLPTFDSRVLLARYLARISAIHGAESQISLFAAKLDFQACPNAGTVVDEFLQRSVRAGDFVASYDNRVWLIAAVCPATESEHMKRRLAKEWTAFVRNLPNARLPQIEIHYHQTYSLSRDRMELEQTYFELAHPPNSDRPSPVGQTVLVVDDDPEVSQCLGLRLEAAGFRVLTATDGEAGLDAARHYHPDAVVLDVRMPKKDGLTVLREIRRDPKLERTPIVMLSASIRDQHTALEAGASYFVPKPYEAAKVLSALESSLHQEAHT